VASLRRFLRFFGPIRQFDKGSRQSGQNTGFGTGGRFWKGCKPNFVCAPCGAERIICLSGQYPRPVSLARDLERAAPWSPIWPCSRWGFPCLLDYSRSGGLLPRLFTLTADTQLRRRYVLCGTVRRKALRLFSRVYLTRTS